uniref:acetyl-CoA carboxylase beta subunit n=1 Tax=Hydnora esculenta TaxID=1851369 RepID=UPI00211390BD|nr:acetyl-CoA carboxylase beta subunit [Hydnora esculenta]USN93638.1 acetyl-CoA carboxylase beta subunit [Hydnora esculenta]
MNNNNIDIKKINFICTEFIKDNSDITELNNFIIFFDFKNEENFVETSDELSLKYYLKFNCVNEINYNWGINIANYLDFKIYDNITFFSFIISIDPSTIAPGMKFKHLWILCDNCEDLNYKKNCRENFFVCETCGIHLKINSWERINLLLDQKTWNPFKEDENLFVVDPIDFDLNFYEEKPIPEEVILTIKDVIKQLELTKETIKEMEFDTEILKRLGYEDEFFTNKTEKLNETELKEKIIYKKNDNNYESDTDINNTNPYDAYNYYPYFDDFDDYMDDLMYYVRNTGLTEAVQTGIGKLNGVLVAIGFMDFEFIGGSMGSVVGEKLTRLIEYAEKKSLPIIIICASGGARIQEGILSLMQMAKISSALYSYQSKKNSLYISILTSPTTGGVTASFGMLGDIIIAEPDAYIAFAGKRVIEETLKIEVPEGLQESNYLFEKGSCDLLVPRNLLKYTISELFKLHGIYPTN